MRFRTAQLFAFVVGVQILQAQDGDIRISAPAAGSEIAITTANRLAGAIHSLTWNGQEFIDSVDHGRQLQSASNFDCGAATMHAETFNPTEAGSRFDGAGSTSTSRLLHSIHGKDWLQTTSQMAFWLRPGDKSSGHPAKNTQNLSNHWNVLSFDQLTIQQVLTIKFMEEAC